MAAVEHTGDSHFIGTETHMAADKYRHAEDEYFKLRGQFDTGRLTQDQFDEKLRELMVQDDKGRYWMLGADSGKWYYYDGTKWVTGEPYTGAAAPATMAETTVGGTPAPASSPQTASPRRAPVSTPPAPSGRGVPLVPILVVLLLLILAAAALFLYQNRGQFLAQQPLAQITPVLPPTITRAPSPTAAAIVPTQAQATVPAVSLVPIATKLPTIASPTAVSVTSAPTSAPLPSAPTSSPAPTVTIVVETVPAATTEVLPTLLPTITNVPTIGPTLAPTNVPTALPTAIPPTNTPSLPPGIYVTKIEISPSPPKRNQPITFTATFVNTSGKAQGYDWLVQLYDPNKAGANKRFGESNVAGITVPTGTSQFSVTYPGVKGAGGCITLYGQAEFQSPDKSRTPFQDGKGNYLQAGFDVCP